MKFSGTASWSSDQMILPAREQRFRKVVLLVIQDNLNARGFYEAKGFVNTGKTCVIEGAEKPDCFYEYVLSQQKWIKKRLSATRGQALLNFP